MPVLANTQDPTRTKTLRRRYAQRLRGQLAKLNAVIREGIAQRDIFSLNQADPRPPNVFRFDSDSRKIDRFMEWLREQEDRGVHTVITRNDNTYIRTTYHRGIDHANRELRKLDVRIDEEAVENIFRRPIHQDAVQNLFTRNFEELQGITSEMNRQISRELSAGFTAGENPRRIASRITDRVDKIGKTRATVLARTEVINAHSTATLNRYERFGVEGVTVRAEVSTAGDRRVCPVCASLEGETFTIDEARSGTWTFNPDDPEIPDSLKGAKRFKPPIHPQCRCALIPVVDA